MPHRITVRAVSIVSSCMQEEQVEYLEDSEVDFSSGDDEDEEDDMEDLAGPDGGRPFAGQLGKRPAGTVLAPAIDFPV